MNEYGRELILDLHECDPCKFTRESIAEFMIELCELIDMERCELHFWDYEGDPEGYEQAADHFSLEKTNRPKDFISMMKKLGEMNLAEFAPLKFTEIFFYDHPPISKRIKFAEMFDTS